MSTTWQEYNIDDSKLYEWLPWGGLIHPNILRNKDESLLGVFSYAKENKSQEPLKKESLVLKNGWVIGVEVQKFGSGFRYYVSVTWNPFFLKREWVSNTLSGKVISYQSMPTYFYSVLQELQDRMSVYSDCRLLENEEVLSYLYSTLSMDDTIFSMPDIPLYIDALMAGEIEFDVSPTGFCIHKKHVAVISLLGIPSDDVIPFIPYDYRFCRRFLAFGKKEAQRDLDRYTASWCKGRSSIKNFMQEELLSNLNGYYTTNIVFFHEDESELEKITLDVDANFKRMGIPHILEEYNLKDVWWGSLPGLFRSNIKAPIIGVSDLKDFLIFPERSEINV